MLSRTFWRTQGGFMSVSVDSFELSPVYQTASAALGLLARGVQLSLPDGYDRSVLETITSLTGAYGREVRVTERQAVELALIADTLVTDHADLFGPITLDSLRSMIQTVADKESP